MPRYDDEANLQMNEKDARKRNERQLILDALQDLPPGLDFVPDDPAQDGVPPCGKES